MKVSVLMLTYNHETYIAQAIEREMTATSTKEQSAIKRDSSATVLDGVTLSNQVQLDLTDFYEEAMMDKLYEWQEKDVNVYNALMKDKVEPMHMNYRELEESVSLFYGDLEYAKRIEEKINYEHKIERRMEDAVKNDEFFVMYQPKIELSTDKIIGAEALVRWNSSDPELGFLSPAKFIPLFEKNGFIEELDFIVYEKVFKFLRNQMDIGNNVVPISVNMSRNHTKEDKINNFISNHQNNLQYLQNTYYQILKYLIS